MQKSLDEESLAGEGIKTTKDKSKEENSNLRMASRVEVKSVADQKPAQRDASPTTEAVVISKVEAKTEAPKVPETLQTVVTTGNGELALVRKLLV